MDRSHTGDPNLAKKAKLLLESSYLTGDGSLSAKQLVFYTLAGIKPVSEVDSCHLVWLSPTYAESRNDSRAGVRSFLKSLGLQCAFKDPYDGTVMVSLQKELLQAMRSIKTRGDEATVYQRYGELYGYPETAVEAVVNEWVRGLPSLLSNDEQDRVESDSGLPRDAFFFRLSKEHWQEELQTLREWYGMLVLYRLDSKVAPSERT